MNTVTEVGGYAPVVASDHSAICAGQVVGFREQLNKAETARKTPRCWHTSSGTTGPICANHTPDNDRRCASMTQSAEPIIACPKIQVTTSRTNGGGRAVATGADRRSAVAR